MTPALIRHSLNREILRLSLPSILANITVPLVGLVDTAVAGHICPRESSTYIAAISIGAMLFSLLYWGFTFLRTGTGGLTAQAFGRKDWPDCAGILVRSASIALGISVLLLCIQSPFAALCLKITEANAHTEELALRYFMIRVWAAPATMMLMAFRGWFMGMQDSMSSMWTDLVVNAVNIAGSFILSFGIGPYESIGFSGWHGIGFDGVACGTVIAQYCGLLFCIVVAATKYRNTLSEIFHIPVQARYRTLFSLDKLAGVFKLNADLFIRSLCFIVIYIGYTLIAARYGDLMLAASSILMQIMMLFSYITDGFAYAGEALTGRFTGSRNLVLLRKSVAYTFVWSMGISLIFSLLYCFISTPMLHVMTTGEDIIIACRQFYPWLILMPPLGCIAFTWDGIYQGATSSGAIRNTMLLAALSYFLIWLIFSRLLNVAPCTDPSAQGPVAIHILFAAYFAHLACRSICLSATYKKSVLSKIGKKL